MSNNKKYRAWDERNNEFAFSEKDDCFYINTKGVLFMYALPNPEGGLATVYHKSYDVDEFTGLQDANGVDVYSGDTLETYNFTDEIGNDHYLRHVVEWSDRFCGWFCRNVTAKRGNDDGCVQLWVYAKDKKFNVAGDK